MDKQHFTIIAGHDVREAMDREIEGRVKRDLTGFKSEDLCKVQEDLAVRGILGAQLVRSMFGWSVRYDSGLQNWGLLASSRQGTLDGSFKAAVEWAEAWVAKDPLHRYAWASRREVERDGFKPIEEGMWKEGA